MAAQMIWPYPQEGNQLMISNPGPSSAVTVLFACLLAAWSAAALAQIEPVATPSAQAGSESSVTLHAGRADGGQRGVIPEWPNFGWSARTAMDDPRWGHAAVSFSSGTFPDNSSFVYVIGGNNSSAQAVSRVSRYDVNAAIWTDMAPLETAVHQVSAVRVGQHIFVPGGYVASFSPTSALQIYDIESDTWEAGASMPLAVGDYAIGAYNDRYIYLVGGYTGSGDTSAVQLYDTNTNTWSQATAKPGTAVAGLRGGIANGQIVVTGGFSQAAASQISDTWIGTIDPEDPTSITWTQGPDYPGGTAGRLAGGVPPDSGQDGAPSLPGVVLFTGGDPDGQGTAALSGTWLFELATETWYSLPSMPVAASNISNFVGVVSEGKLHLVSVGGYDGSDFQAVNHWLTLVMTDALFSDRFEQ